MKAAFLFTGLLFFLLSGQAQDHADLRSNNREAIEKWINDFHVPAVGVAIIKDKKLKEVRMYGSLKEGVPAPGNALFNVASLTKPIVAIVTLKLVSEGAWDLDEPLFKYWIDPDLKNDPRHKLLTTRLVLSHQTGFKNWRYLANDQKLSFDTTPGTRFGYSGEGFEYLRHALENKFGKGIEELTDSILFQPLGMHDTRFKWDVRTDESRFARWHDAQGKEYTRDYKATTVNAADDVITTLRDYGAFASHVLQGAGLKKSIYNQMIQPHVVTKNDMHMTLGWELMKDIGPKKEFALIHSGSDAGVKTLVILLPVSGEGIVLFTNGDEGYKIYENFVSTFLTHGKEMMSRAK